MTFAHAGARFACTLALAALAATPLAACGIKGPLKLPQSEKPASETPPADGSAQQPQQTPKP